ncbi:sigma-70 family RNA polymerase sigma factor [Sphingomonas colocasiae]|uniref:Sigma-70 family RNA polymerase sigma factor n=1 Tax=Sphingomonas colocasiae TaxID=1848973 RepID=A0ABS7PSZ9_9SPHN|nr:sigma-70 family RNA polymerase sigma factor [Sphingomonas colocasiae]MBY8824471.1 sigma-70 family RNA polymerase sigma factor [Sphingomonas colocasiae]
MTHPYKSSVAATVYRQDPMDRIRQFMPLVRRLAWHVHGSGHADLEVEDLVQTGLVALTECVRRHDGEGDDGFAAYAKMRVRGAMIDMLRRNATISRGAMERRREMRDKSDTLQIRLGRPPSSAELAAAMEMSESELAALRVASTPLRFEGLDDCYSDSDPAFADDEPDSFEQLAGAETRTRLTDAIAGLAERHQLIVQLYFVEELNLSEIAEILGVSVPRVHQIKAQALAALREAMGGDVDFIG